MYTNVSLSNNNIFLNLKNRKTDNQTHYIRLILKIKNKIDSHFSFEKKNNLYKPIVYCEGPIKRRLRYKSRRHDCYISTVRSSNGSSELVNYRIRESYITVAKQIYKPNMFPDEDNMNVAKINLKYFS